MSVQLGDLVIVCFAAESCSEEENSAQTIGYYGTVVDASVGSVAGKETSYEVFVPYLRKRVRVAVSDLLVISNDHHGDDELPLKIRWDSKPIGGELQLSGAYQLRGGNPTYFRFTKALVEPVSIKLALETEVRLPCGLLTVEVPMQIELNEQFVLSTIQSLTGPSSQP